MMRYGKTKQDGKNVKDLTTIVYNHRITVKNIPLAAYDYVVNGKPAIDCVLELKPQNRTKIATS